MKLIASALVKAQKQFGPALKTASNPHFRSKYANLSACVEAVIDALNDNGIFLTQHVSDNPDGVIVETVFLHESGERLDCGKLFVPASKRDAQGFGSAETYARRYSLMAACGIAPEDDDGNGASRPQKTAETPRHKPTQGTVVSQAQEDQCIAAAQDIEERMQADDLIGAYEIYEQFTDAEERTAIWSKLPAPTRRAIKAHNESLKEKK